MPRMISYVKALTPSRVKPSLRIAEGQHSQKSPDHGAEPPASAVPPMTAPATAENMMIVPPARGSMELIRNASRIPAKPPACLPA